MKKDQKYSLLDWKSKLRQSLLVIFLLWQSVNAFSQNSATLQDLTAPPRLNLANTTLNSGNPSAIIGLAVAPGNFCPGTAVGDLTISNSFNKNIVFGIGNFGGVAEKMRLSYDGKLGIGTATPTGLIHLAYPNTSNNTRQKLQHWEWVANSNFQLDIFGDAHPARGGFVQFGGWNNDVSLAFVVDSKTSVEAGTSLKGFFLKNNGLGLLGIGTTNPQSYLDIVTPNSNALRLQNNSATLGSSVGIDFYSGGLVSAEVKARIEAIDIPVNGASVGNSALAFLTRPDAGGNATEKMRILPNGNIGIGTNAPNASLTVAGKNMILGGNTIMGSYAPTNAVFEMQSVDEVYLNLMSNIQTDGKANTIVLGSSKTYNWAGINIQGRNGEASLPFVVSHGAKEQLRILPNGNVGIGTTAPGTLMHLHHQDNPVLSISQPDIVTPTNNHTGTLGIAADAGHQSLAASRGDLVLRAVNSGNDLIIANNGGAENSGSIIFTTGSAYGWYEKARMEINTFGHVNLKGKTQINTEPTNPDAAIAGLNMAETANYTWVQSNDNKPLALNPVSSGNNGYVAIGFTPGSYTIPTNYKLAVKGNIICEEVRVKYANKWPDFVFDESYKLKTLDEVELFINENKHLPDVPSAEEVAVNGIESGKMDATLLKKIEELTLYMIEQKKQMDDQKREIELLKEQNKLLLNK